jgi:GNAT superfamily N-acetyltransferase
MFRVRKMEPEDFSFAIELANTMNWNMTSEDFEFNSQLEPNGCFMLLSGQERIGLATCINYGKIGWFGNLIVKKSYRKQGAGAILVNHAITYLRSTGVTTIGLYAYNYLTDFYAKIGFKPEMDFLVLKTKKVAAPVILEATENIRPIKQPDVRGVLDFDKHSFGAQRSKTLEPIFQDANDLCYVTYENTQVIGYVASKVFDRIAEIGPLVCNTYYPETIPSLLQLVLSKLNGKEAYLYLPVDKTELLNIATKAGFKEEFRLVRMFLGPVVAQDWVCAAESLERG